MAIGLLPGYDAIGIAAPILLALFRFGQGLGLGGEWGGAVLLATENAPPHKKAWYGMLPKLELSFNKQLFKPLCILSLAELPAYIIHRFYPF